MSAVLNFTPKRKLSAKEIVGDVKKIFKEADPKAKKIPLFKIGGFVNRYDPVETNYGTAIRFIGDFVAVNQTSGEMFRSNRLFLPSIMTDEMTAHLAAAKKRDEDASVEFGFDVSIIPDEKSATGYVYMAEPVVKVQESDAISALAAKLGVKALPAPETAKSDKGKDHEGKGKGK